MGTDEGGLPGADQVSEKLSIGARLPRRNRLRSSEYVFMVATDGLADP